MAGSQDIEAGRAYVTVYLKRANYDKQVDDLKRSAGNAQPPKTPSQAVANSNEEYAELAPIAQTIGYKGDVGNIIGLLRKLRDSADTAAPSMVHLGQAAVAAGPIFLGMRGVFNKTVGSMQKVPAVAKSVSASLGDTAASFAIIPAASQTMSSKVVSSVHDMKLGVVSASKALLQMPGQIINATSAAVSRVGAALAKTGAITAGVAAALAGSATLAARSWAAYGETIRGVQNDLLKFQLTAEEASIIARVSDQTGESTERLAEQMRDGTRDFSRWRNEMIQTGTLMSGPQLAASLALSRAYFSLKSSVVGLKNAIGEALGPALTEGAELFKGIIQGVTKWVSENQPLVVQIFKIASSVAIAAAGVSILGSVIAGIGTAVSPFAVALAGIAGYLAILEVRTGAGGSLWTAYGVSVQRVSKTVMQSLGQMLEFADRVFGGVADAIVAGDLATAVDIMWAAAKTVWFAALQEIDDSTGRVFSGLLKSLAAGKWAAAGEMAMGALEISWLAGMNVFDTMISNIKEGLAKLLQWTVVNVFGPLLEQAEALPGAFGISARAQTSVLGIMTSLTKASLDAKKSARDDSSNIAREEQITRLMERQHEIAAQMGPEAEKARATNEKALTTAIAAAEASRAAADSNKLTEEDFAVSQDVQSITRFSGEALGLSVGRGEGPAEKTAKLNEEQLRELKEIGKNMNFTHNEILRLIAIGGFQ